MRTCKVTRLTVGKVVCTKCGHVFQLDERYHREDKRPWPAFCEPCAAPMFARTSPMSIQRDCDLCGRARMTNKRLCVDCSVDIRAAVADIKPFTPRYSS